MKILALLPWADWLAVLGFLVVWVGYNGFAKFWSTRRPSLLAATNGFRLKWMLQATSRDPRVLDGFITQSLAGSSSFFASTTIFIIGGLVALLGTIDKAAEFVREMPFAQPTPVLVFEFKIIVLLVIFVYAFFRFSWAMRQYTIVAVVVGSMPEPKQFESGEFQRESEAARAGKLLGLAAETFNDGLRAYYFSFAVLAWFFSPGVFMVATGLVVLILYAREFHSDVLGALTQ
jgi:uncharacterized membrane protein